MMLFLIAACSNGGTDSAAGADATVYLTTDHTENGHFVVSYTTEPDPIVSDDYFTVTATIYAAEDTATPLPGAVVEMDASMPSHGHGMNVTPTVTDNGDGTYTGSPFLFHMTGDWLMSFAVTHEGTTDVAEMNVLCCGG